MNRGACRLMRENKLDSTRVNLVGLSFPILDTID